MSLTKDKLTRRDDRNDDDDNTGRNSSTALNNSNNNNSMSSHINNYEEEDEENDSDTENHGYQSFDYRDKGYSTGSTAAHLSFAERRRQKRIIVLVVVCILLIVLLIVSFVAALVIPKLITRTRRSRQQCSFSAIMLGNNGGLTEENLSAILLSRNTSNAFLALDAGNLLFGLRQFVRRNDMMTNSYPSSNSYLSFPFPSWTSNDEMKRAGFMLRNHVWGYVLGHAHLDHISGLVLNSPEDYFTDTNQMIGNTTNRSKPIIALESALNTLRNDVFNDKLWPDIVKHGKQYQYKQVDNYQSYLVNDLLGLNPFIKNPNLYEQWEDVSVKVLPLCHESLNSTAFLFNGASDNSQVIYFSDTGVSSFEEPCDWEQSLNNIWQEESLNVDNLKAIFIEVSFPNSNPIDKMFGHLRPIDLVLSLQYLKTVKGIKSLDHIKVIIQHVKPSFNAGEDPRSIIKKEISDGADTHDVDAEFLFPEQGEYLCL